MAAVPLYPPPPWRLRGDVALVGAPVRADRPGAPGGATVRAIGGWTLGGLLLARYGVQATLPYHELIVFSGLATAGGRAGFVVSHIYVDSEASMQGGREIWGLPKELAAFRWSAREVVVEQDGRRLVRARLRRRGGRVPVPLLAPAFGARGGRALLAVGTGVLRRGAPVLASLDVPASSPFAGLGLGGTRAGVAGEGLDLRFPAPRP